MVRGNASTEGAVSSRPPADDGLHDITVGGSRQLARLALTLNEQFPILCFLGFGCYYAWIWLCYSSAMLVPPSAPTSGDMTFTMYLYSTSALVVMLVLAAVFERAFTRVTESRLATLCFAALASIATLVVRLRVENGTSDPLFIVGCVLTGMGTSIVALRLGSVYARVSSRRAVMYTALSFVLASLLYFAVVGAPHGMDMFLMACLPTLAVLFTVTLDEEPEGVFVRRPAREAIEMLPRGFFPRLVIGIAVLSVIAGLTHGATALTSGGELGASGRDIVAGTGSVCLLVYVVAASMGENFDFSRLYYPIILMLLVGLVVIPLFGDGMGRIGGTLIGIGYALFIMMIWCLLANVSYVTGRSAVRVYGVGRGASAFGTTVGWFCDLFLLQHGYDAIGPMAPMTVTVSASFVLLVISLLIFNDRTVSLVLHMRTRSDEARASTWSVSTSVVDGAARTDDVRRAPDVVDVDMSWGAHDCGSGDEGRDDGPAAPGADASGFADGERGDGGQGEPDRRQGLWTRKCNAVVDEYHLSERESDVLFLLSKGRTINYIADELHISFNTAKSHIRHVYVKTGVHTRQELLDMIEDTRV
jgi:DNA-binding CsgD family transcriptional regulator